MSKKLRLCLEEVPFLLTKFESVVTFGPRTLAPGGLGVLEKTITSSTYMSRFCLLQTPVDLLFGGGVLCASEAVFFLSNLNNPNSVNNTVSIYH